MSHLTIQPSKKIMSQFCYQVIFPRKIYVTVWLSKYGVYLQKEALYVTVLLSKRGNCLFFCRI